MTEEITELQAITEELTGDITRIERHIEDNLNIIKGRFEKLEGLIEGLTKAAELDIVIKKKHAAAIKVLDNRVSMLKDGHNMHSHIIANKFPEIEQVKVTEGPNGPEKGPIGPN